VVCLPWLPVVRHQVGGAESFSASQPRAPGQRNGLHGSAAQRSQRDSGATCRTPVSRSALLSGWPQFNHLPSCARQRAWVNGCNVCQHDNQLCRSLCARGKNGAAGELTRRDHGACYRTGAVTSPVDAPRLGFVLRHSCAEIGMTPSSYTTESLCRVLRDALLRARQYSGGHGAGGGAGEPRNTRPAGT
jgi:hypothetical protein